MKVLERPAAAGSGRQRQAASAERRELHKTSTPLRLRCQLRENEAAGILFFLFFFLLI